MSALASRRTLLAGLATASIAGLPAPAAGQAEDAHLIALIARWRAVSATYDDAAARAEDLEAIGWPKAPDALFWREEDRDLKLTFDASRRADNRLWYHVEGQAAGLRGPQTRVQTLPVEPSDGYPPGTTHCRKKGPWPERQARADEIVAAYDGWQTARRAAEDASGYTAAIERAKAIGREIAALEVEIEASSPASLAGLAALAAYVEVVAGDDLTECQGLVVLLRGVRAIAGGKA